MQKEYKIIEVKLSEAEKKMNDMAKHGWTVASTDIYLGGVALTKAAKVLFPQPFSVQITLSPSVNS